MNNQEPLDDTLLHENAAAFGVPQPSDEIRARILARTSARVRWRRHRRWLGVVCAIVAAYAAGLGTITFQSRETTAPANVETAQAPAAPSESGDALTALLQDPEALALRVSQGPLEERMSLLKRAGDRLIEWGNFEQATHCYRRLLDLMASSGAIQIDSTDNWLLAALKRARQKETAHVSSNT